MSAVLSMANLVDWDLSNWTAALEFWTGHSSRTLAASSALELGTRHGGLALWLAMKGAHVVCSDVGGPSIQARQVHRIAGVSDRIQYQAIDATRIPYADRFDVVTCKSVLGAIGIRRGPQAQAKAIGEMRRALCPGGELFFAENLAGSPFHNRLRRRFQSWGNGDGFVTVEAMLDFVAPFAQVCYRIINLGGESEPTERPANGINRIGRLIRDRTTAAARYVMVGVARK